MSHQESSRHERRRAGPPDVLAIGSGSVTGLGPLTVPLFAGGRFDRTLARSLAACTGEALLAFGALPRRYEEEVGRSGDWGEVLEVEAGYGWLLAGDCERFTLTLISDDPSMAALQEATTYCGWAVVTRLTGRLLQRSYACDEDGRTIKVVMKLRIVAERAGIGTGRLRRVLAGTEYIEGWFDNAGLALKEGTRVDFAYSIGVRGDVGRDAIPRSSSDWGYLPPVTEDGLGPARWQRLEVLGEHVPPGRGACWLGAVPLHRRRVGGRLRT